MRFDCICEFRYKVGTIDHQIQKTSSHIAHAHPAQLWNWKRILNNYYPHGGDTMHRRDLLKFAAASGLAWPLAGSRLAFADSGPITIASYAPMSGAFAANGKFNDMGVQLSVQTHGTVLGRELRSITIDTEGKPATAVRS